MPKITVDGNPIEVAEGRTLLQALDDVPALMEGQTICAFADAAAWPIQGILRHFRSDFDAHLAHKKCPFPESFEL